MDRGDSGEVPAKFMWRPSRSKVTLMTQFREKINSQFHLDLADYHQLYKWSCENYRFFHFHESKVQLRGKGYTFFFL